MASRPAELAAVAAFTKTDDHYTYTLADDDTDDEDMIPEEDDSGEEEIEDEESGEDGDYDDISVSADDYEPRFTAITFFFWQISYFFDIPTSGGHILVNIRS